MITGTWLPLCMYVCRENSWDIKKQKVKQSKGVQQQDSTITLELKGQGDVIILPESNDRSF